jgi:hypothetical protein
MAFWPDWPDGRGYEQRQCSTWQEAEQMHERMVREVSRPAAWLAWAGRVVRGMYEQAVREFQQQVLREQ